MMVEINADKEEAEVVRVKVEAEEATANEKVTLRTEGPASKYREIFVETSGSFVELRVHSTIEQCCSVHVLMFSLRVWAVSG